MAVGNPLDVVFAWETAVSTSDIDRACALSDERIEVGDPRSSGRGHLAVRALIAGGSRVALQLLRTFQRGDVAVVEHRVTSAVSDGSCSTIIVGTVFKVSRGRLVSVARYDTLGDALCAAGLGLDSEYVRLTAAEKK